MHRRVGPILIVVALAAGAFAPMRAASPADASVRWEAGADGAERVLVLELPTPGVAFDATVTAESLDIVVGSPVGSPLPDGVTARPDGEVTRLSFAHPGVALRGVRRTGAAVRFDVVAPPTAIVAADTYAIGVGDVVTVSVYKNPDLSGDLPVTPDGNITMPLLGAVRAAGRTERGLADDLTRVLAKDYLVEPQVSVSVKAYQSQFVYVTGAVQRSSRVAIRPGITLRGVLAEAGVALSQGMTVELRRAIGQTAVLDSGKLDEFPPRDGDVLTVQEPRYVSIYGEVRRPNRLVLTPGMTLLQAIALSEGLTEWASKKEVRILRKGPTGSEELTVNLNKVEERQVADPPLQSDDVIIVKRRFL